MKKTTLFTLLSMISVITFAQFNVSTYSANDLYWNNGQVGIGLDNPKSKLDINLSTNFMYADESALRITYPIPFLDPNKPTLNENIFHIRQSTPLGGGFSTKMIVHANGNVGIATATPDAKLHVKDINGVKLDVHLEGFTLIDGIQASLLLGTTTGASYGEWGIEYNNSGANTGLNFWKPFGSNGFGNYFLFIADNGNVSIGTDDAQGYKLAVKGNMIAEKVVVKLHADWPDFVFTKKYDLMPLEDVERFIQKNSHLPNVPSAEEVKKGGIDLGSMDATLLQKIEELTLYVIELKKEIDELKK
jgi:hypothetical protein